jgi:hypothetical protein
MKFETVLLLYSAGLFIGMLILLEVGCRVGRKKYLADPEGFEKGSGAIDGAVFGLLGLLIAFTFSGAASRLEDRRNLVTEEANAIGTAYLRVDLLPEKSQPEMKELFRRYLDLRLETYRHAGHLPTAMKLYDQSVQLQNSIWNHATKNCQLPDGAVDACKLLLPSLNEMIDITTTRLMATRLHPPAVIYLLMGALCLLSALLAGHGLAGNKSRKILHMIVFAFVMSLVVYVILDLEYPRLGLIRMESADQVLIDLRNSMK